MPAAFSVAGEELIAASDRFTIFGIWDMEISIRR